MTAQHTDSVERAARALCRHAWERHFAGKDLDAYVDIHWTDHAVGARIAIAAALDGSIVVPRAAEGVVIGILAPYRKQISDTPELLSLLYDIDMLPEQTVTTAGAIRLAAMCEVWKRGDAAGRGAQPRTSQPDTGGEA